MRAVVQRVRSAGVTVAGEQVAAIGPGLLVLVGVSRDDTPGSARTLAAKLHTLRILEGDRSAADLGSPLLVVSQFTLYLRRHEERAATVLGAGRPRGAGRAAGGRRRRRAAAAGRSGGDWAIRRAHARLARQRRPGDAARRELTIGSDPRDLIRMESKTAPNASS